MLPEKRRKEALNRRAIDYTDRVCRPNSGITSSADVMAAYLDGYRAAMADARAAWNSEPSHTMAVEALLRFLRPLR